jgi:hypothetical protein
MGSTAGDYNLAEVSAGYQAGVEKFSFALFFMNEKALAYSWPPGSPARICCEKSGCPAARRARSVMPLASRRASQLMEVSMAPRS